MYESSGKTGIENFRAKPSGKYENSKEGERKFM